MKNLTIFDITSRAMSAQQTRLNAIASNLANASNVASSADNAYRAIRPIFEAEYSAATEQNGIASVNTVGIQRSETLPEKRYAPTHPLANEDGYIFGTNVDTHEEMVDMMEASRQYQNNIEVLATAKSLMLKTLSVGK